MVNLVALHGFWGAPKDWEKLVAYLRPDKVWIPNLLSPGPLDPSHDFQKWTANFTDEVAERFQGPVWLAGYSQGGRLALHAQLLRPDLFARTLLISTHPGQFEPAEAQSRQQWIDTWRVKFAIDPFEKLERDWNAQEVFGQSSPEAKPVVDRKRLAAALVNWSALNHGFDWSDLQSLPKSVLWLFGALDQKFLLVKSLLERQGVGGQIEVIDGSGHRILVDAPAAAALSWRARSSAEG